MRSSSTNEFSYTTFKGSRFCAPGWRYQSPAHFGTVVGLHEGGFPILKVDANTAEILSIDDLYPYPRELTDIVDLTDSERAFLSQQRGSLSLSLESLKRRPTTFNIVELTISSCKTASIFILEIKARRKMSPEFAEASFIAQSHDFWCILESAERNLDSLVVWKVGNPESINMLTGICRGTPVGDWTSSEAATTQILYVSLKVVLGEPLSETEEYLAKTYLARGRDVLCVTLQESLYRISVHFIDDRYVVLCLDMVSERSDRTADSLVRQYPKGFCCWQITVNDPFEDVDPAAGPFMLMQADTLGRRYFSYTEPVGATAGILMPYTSENPTLMKHFISVLREQKVVVLEENQTNAGAESLGNQSAYFYNLTIHPIGRYMLVCSWRNITERMRSRDKCERMHLILDAAPLMCFMTSDSDNLTYLNAYGKCMLKFPPDPFPLEKFSTRDFLPEITAQIVSQSVGPSEYTTLLSKIDGTSSNVFVKVTRFETFDSGDSSDVVRTGDSSKMIAAKYVIYVQEERRAAGSKDEESERLLTEARLSAKNDLLATVSHEMRTPLNGIVGNADLLSLSVSDPWQIGVVRNISTCSKILLQIINDILDFAKVDSRKMELEMLPFSVSDCADAAIGVVSAALRGKKQNLIFHICPGSPREVIGDPTRTKQLVLNILNNASKFTPVGGTLELGLCVTKNFINKRTCKRSTFYDDCTFDDLQGGSFRRIFTGPDNETKSHLFRFFVRDTGTGMSDQHLQSIFTPFTQVRSLGSSKGFGLHNPESGTGLGLSIVRKLLELMEGCCNVRTVEGKGSCFSVRVPVDLPDQKRSDDVDIVAAVSVAVVSRAKVHAKAIRSLLSHIGAKVQVSDRIEEVDGNPALCLLDVATDEDLAARMEQLVAIGDPNFDARLKALIQKAALIVPPWASANVQQRASEASSSHCLFAPLTVGALQELIKDAIRGSSSADSSSTSLRESVGADVPIKILVVEDNRPNRFVLVQLLERLGVAGENVVQAENGEEALTEMRTASFDLIFMDIHMPIMSGWEAASRIRSKPEDFQPFGLLIALTAASTLEEREESMKYMDMFISKPLQLTKLVDTLNQCCKRLKIRKVFEIPKEKVRQRRPCKSSESISCTNDRAGERPTSAWAAWIPGGGGSRERIGIFFVVALLIFALIVPRLFRSECIPISS